MSDFTTAARQLADALAATAVAREAANELPFAEVDLLRGSGLLKLLVPLEKGGSGGRWSDAVDVTRIVSAADGSIGHLIGYHYLNYLSAIFAATPSQREAIDRGVVVEDWYLGDSVNPLDPALTVSREGQTIRFSGKRSFSTGAAVADRILFTFRVGDKGAVTLLPRSRAGVTANGDWDNLGQRLSASGSISFDNVELDIGEVLGAGLDAPPPPDRPSPMSAMIQLILSTIQVGIAEGALQAGAAYTREHSRPWFKSGAARAAEDPLIASAYGRLSANVAAARALLDKVTTRLQLAVDRRDSLTAEERAEIATASFELKIVSTEVSLATTSKIFELMGARASANRYGFDRFWRNARTLTLHDPVVYKELEVGRFVLDGEHPTPSTYS